MNTLITAFFTIRDKKQRRTFLIQLLQCFKEILQNSFSQLKGLVQGKRFAYVFKFRRIQEKGIQEIKLLQYSMGKQLSVSTKKLLKINIHQQSEFEQASTQNYVISFEKLLKQMIFHEQERNALMLYFEFDLVIYDIPYLKFDAISQGMFHLNYQRLDQNVSKKIQISEEIKLLLRSVVNKDNLSEEFQVVNLNSNWEIQAWFYKLKRSNVLTFQQQGNDELVVSYKPSISRDQKNKQVQIQGNLYPKQQVKQCYYTQFVKIHHSIFVI